jgi:hypothetical protein
LLARFLETPISQSASSFKGAVSVWVLARGKHILYIKRIVYGEVRELTLASSNFFAPPRAASMLTRDVPRHGTPLILYTQTSGEPHARKFRARDGGT